MGPAPRPWQDRFWEKVRKAEGCWEWTGAKTGGGYGKLGVARGDIRNAHRLAWELEHGRSIPAGLVIDHLCNNRGCVNPAHLDLVTHSENSLRTFARGRHVHWSTKKTHCKHGHPFDAQNTAIAATGQRVCKTCKRARCRIDQAERRKRLRDQELPPIPA